MSKYYGRIGYVDTVDNGNGVWEETLIHEGYYYGEVINPSVRYKAGDKINDDLSVTDKVSILADAYALAHFSKIKFIEYEGELWEVDQISVARPRLILTLGGVYNGQFSGRIETESSD